MWLLPEWLLPKPPKLLEDMEYEDIIRDGIKYRVNENGREQIYVDTTLKMIIERLNRLEESLDNPKDPKQDQNDHQRNQTTSSPAAIGSAARQDEKQDKQKHE